MEWRRASREKAHELPKWVLDDVSSFFSSLLLEGFSSSLHSYYSRDFGSFNFIWVWRNTRSRFSVRSNGLDLVTVGLDERQDNRRHRNGKPHQMKLNQISAATCTNFGQLLLIHGLTHTHTLTRTHSPPFRRLENWISPTSDMRRWWDRRYSKWNENKTTIDDGPDVIRRPKSKSKNWKLCDDGVDGVKTMRSQSKYFRVRRGEWERK